MRVDKSERPLASSPFKTCSSGHETVYQDQFIYDNQKRMICRACAEESKSGRKRAKI